MMSLDLRRLALANGMLREVPSPRPPQAETPKPEFVPAAPLPSTQPHAAQSRA